MSEPCRFLLITATDASAHSRMSLANLVASVERQAVRGDHIVVLRGERSGALPPSRSLAAHTVQVPLDTPLSHARNLALGYARRRGLLDLAGAVSFPDDDCGYPDGLLERVGELVRGGESIVCVPYAPTPRELDRRRFPATDLPLTPALVMRAASSNNSFFAASAVRATGDFDERYGLGARFGASEDADYILRMLCAGFSGCYRGGDLAVQHPYKPHRPTQYYLGNVAVLAKHAVRGGTAYLLLRRLAYGLRLTAARRIAPRQYVLALMTAAGLVTGRSARSPRTSAPEW